VHTLESTHPNIALRKYVRAYAQRKTDLRDVSLIAFDIHFDDGLRVPAMPIAVIGPQTQLRATVEFFGKVDSFGVFFQPAGFSQLFGVPMRMLANVGIEAGSILGHNIRSVWNELGESGCFQSRVAVIERFLLKAQSIMRFSGRMLETTNRLLALQGRISISDLACQEGIGLRHFERRFSAEVGLPPKLYARIARFQTALDIKVSSPWMNWLEISHALGYYDQMHMIHDFKDLGVPTLLHLRF
jgi:AraC-like DNA-binding protein